MKNKAVKIGKFIFDKKTLKQTHGGGGYLTVYFKGQQWQKLQQLKARGINLNELLRQMVDQLPEQI